MSYHLNTFVFVLLLSWWRLVYVDGVANLFCDMWDRDTTENSYL